MTSYEEHVLAWLRRELIEHNHQIGEGGKHINVEEVYFEQDGPEDDMIVILFREARRPQCLFGFRIGSREPPPIDNPDWQWQESEDPEGRIPQGHATVIFGNLMEQVEAADMGLPKECDPHGITWI